CYPGEERLPMRRTGSFIPPTLALVSGVAACTGAATREVCPPPAPCPAPAVVLPLASCPPASTAPAAAAPPVAAPAPLEPSPGGAAALRSAMIVTLPTEGRLVIELQGSLANEE